MRNTGNSNTGHSNTGDMNTGNRNTGHMNTGNWNTGNLNTGDMNTGHWNTGDMNTGDMNTGNCNTGNRNTGHWNTGNRNTGCLNTGNGPLRVFDKETNRDDITWPDFFYHDVAAVWVPLSAMTAEEIEKNKPCETVEGYLKVVSPHAGWRSAWDKASDEDRRKCFDIPNWDNEKFKHISGIDVEAELNGEIEMTVAEVEKLVGRKVKIVKESE